ncbi:MAG: hypothetical protein ACYC61_33835 [Isosphaeraceae bacterium]
MASERQIAANRRNALKSTGPRTEAGKARSRRNAITHGLNAHIETLPDDEKDAFEQRLNAWKAALQPCTPYEEDLVRRLAGYSWRLDRAERAQTALIADSIDEAAETDVRQKREAFGDAARRLLPDFAPEGAPEPTPAPRRQIGEYLYVIDDPDDPLFLVMQLERNAEGCQWLRQRWAELRAVLEAGKAWSDPELIRALRLTGHRPLDVADDFGVLEIFVANYVTDRSRPDPFSALWDGLNPLEINRYRTRLIGRRLQDAMPESPEAARDFLLALIDEATARLEAIETDLRAQDAELAEVRPSTHLFDDSAEGRWLRSKQFQYNHAIARIVDRFTRARRRGQVMTADPPPRRRPEKPKPAPPRLVDEKPKPWISPRDRMAKERRKKGARWRTYKIPPWRRPGGRTIYKHYPGYPAPPQPVRRRRKMSAERKRRMARNFIKLFQSLGLWTVLIALVLGAAALPGLADGQRPTTTSDLQIFHHDWHEGHESDRPSYSCPSCHSWSITPTAAGSMVVRGGRNAPAGPVFRVWTALTPGKTQNEPNFARDSGFVAAAKLASAHPRDRSRGPPIPQIAAISAARPPPMALVTVPC